MAWFKSNKEEIRISNILKGTSNPTSSIGDNGQVYLKYGSDTRYAYDETLGGYVLNDYFYSEANQLIGVVGSRTYTKASSGAAIAVMWKNSTYSGPLLISTVESNIAYSYNTSGSLGSATIDGITWYLSTTNYWSNPVENAAAPIIEADYYPTASSRLQEAIEAILEASDFKTSLPTNVVNDSFAKVDGVWQNLIGTGIDDILAGGSKYIKATGSFTSGTSTYEKVEVNCGFKPDLVMVDMEFGNGYTRATYVSTSAFESTDHPTSVWDLRPLESVIYAITPESETGETGITDLTDSGFKYRVNGSNTFGKACTYTAIKFDAEPEPTMNIIDISAITKYHESSMAVCSDVSDIIFNWDGSQSIGANVYVTNPIDVTDLSTLKYELKTLSCYGNGSQAQRTSWNVMVGLMQTAPSGIINAEYSQAGFVAGNDFAYSNTDYGTQTIDVSALSGNYYFVVVAHGWNASVSDLRCA